MTIWTLYMMQCGDNTFYTGITNNLARRMQQHTMGVGAKYTRGRGPFVLLHQETFKSKGAALQREYAVKQLSRQDKEKLFM